MSDSETEVARIILPPQAHAICEATEHKQNNGDPDLDFLDFGMIVLPRKKYFVPLSEREPEPIQCKHSTMPPPSNELNLEDVDCTDYISDGSEQELDIAYWQSILNTAKRKSEGTSKRMNSKAEKKQSCTKLERQRAYRRWNKAAENAWKEAQRKEEDKEEEEYASRHPYGLEF
ncbi:hypothetical protein Moror_14582 [Moniliophthora roreri MCA 2997]|uniref:Uncharacterized protein n=2 Tax=Moniliophthora roreri TaxID=221103 RepID=V2XL99_MONRO|nr:hypothetical protein Moror_14582 [Moniliophthora roreri MCA 2997]KAI3607089.1 hypothetical protein WG66_007903 [Moniliophthora roreri]